MEQSYPDFSKLELIAHLSETFPEKADTLMNKIEDLCRLKDNDFEKRSDESKINIIIKTMLSEQNVLNEELKIILQASLYLKNLDFEQNIKKLLEHEKSIKFHPFLNKNTVKPDWEKNIVKELNLLRDKIQNLIDKCISLSLEIDLNINFHNIFLKKLCFLQKTGICNKVIGDLKESISRFAKYDIILAELEKNNFQRASAIEQELSKYIVENEKNQFSGELNQFIEEFNKILQLQQQLTNKMLTFQMDPVENLLTLPGLINSFSNILFSYTNINCLILAGESLKINRKDIETIKKLESQLLDNFKTFLADGKKVFDKKLTLFSAKDKKAIFKERFLQPIKNRFDNYSYEMVTRLTDILLK